jgi:hypothetical protein
MKITGVKKKKKKCSYITFLPPPSPWPSWHRQRIFYRIIIIIIIIIISMD